MFTVGNVDCYINRYTGLDTLSILDPPLVDCRSTVDQHLIETRSILIR